MACLNEIGADVMDNRKPGRKVRQSASKKVNPESVYCPPETNRPHYVKYALFKIKRLIKKKERERDNDSASPSLTLPFPICLCISVSYSIQHYRYIQTLWYLWGIHYEKAPRYGHCP